MPNVGKCDYRLKNYVSCKLLKGAMFCSYEQAEKYLYENKLDKRYYVVYRGQIRYTMKKAN